MTSFVLQQFRVFNNQLVTISSHNCPDHSVSSVILYRFHLGLVINNNNNNNVQLQYMIIITNIRKRQNHSIGLLMENMPNML